MLLIAYLMLLDMKIITTSMKKGIGSQEFVKKLKMWGTDYMTQELLLYALFLQYFPLQKCLV